MWEELVGLKSQVLRPNLSSSFPCLEKKRKNLCPCGGFLDKGKKSKRLRQRGLNVWTKPNGIFWAKECSGVHWGEPAGPGRT